MNTLQSSEMRWQQTSDRWASSLKIHCYFLSQSCPLSEYLKKEIKTKRCAQIPLSWNMHFIPDVKDCHQTSDNAGELEHYGAQLRQHNNINIQWNHILVMDHICLDCCDSIEFPIFPQTSGCTLWRSAYRMYMCYILWGRCACTSFNLHKKSIATMY